MANKDLQKLINDLNAGLATATGSIQEIIKSYNVVAGKNKELEATINFLLSFDENNFVGKVLDLSKKSKSQLGQDIFVLFEMEFKREGYFVEFGATDGIDLSNTYLLEKEFNWRGILAEPAKCWQKALKENRQADVDFDCVWTETGLTLEFNETEEAEFSTISEFNFKDSHAEARKRGKEYSVNTVSLADLLKRHKAPECIDYLSIDTEGSEYEILRNFDFDPYTISIITCEHNATSDREKIQELLVSKGYERKHETVSRWDDWYVLK